MRRHLENTIEHEGPSFEETVAPVPSVVLDDMMSLLLHPDVERDQRDTGDPSQDVQDARESRGDAEAGERKQRVRQEITAECMVGRVRW